MAAAEAYRNFPGDLDGVYAKLSLSRGDVLNVYLIGSRMWGTASASSDYDLYLVVKGGDSARNSHFQLPGVSVDAVVVGAAYFQQRLDAAKLKELSCIWAPASCKLLEKKVFKPTGGEVGHSQLVSSLSEGHKKDWARAQKLVAGGRLEEGKKVLSHDVRAHLLSLQILTHGKIVDYETGADAVAWLQGTYSKDWGVYAGEFEPKLEAIRQAITSSPGTGGRGELSSTSSNGGVAGLAEGILTLSVAKQPGGTTAAAAAVDDEQQPENGAAEYWFGEDISPGKLTMRQVSVDADEVAVSEVAARLDAAVSAVRAGDHAGAVDKLQQLLAESLERGFPESHASAEAAQGLLNEAAATRKRAAASRRNEVHITNYPSTPHLPFSPTVHDDDIQMPAVSAALLKEETVVTEKLDGGNCCLHDQEVYARTHSAPTTNDWFSRTKMRLSSFAWVQCLRPLKIFGENMEAVHSISYGVPVPSLYLFGVYDSSHGGFWWPWDSIVALAALLDLPTAHVVHRGTFGQAQRIKALMDQEMKQPTAVQRSAPEFATMAPSDHVFPEGFVIRVTRGFPKSDFETCMGKYVRAGHLQTKEDFRRNWQASTDRGESTGEANASDAGAGAPDLEEACRALIRKTRSGYFEWKDTRNGGSRSFQGDSQAEGGGQK